MSNWSCTRCSASGPRLESAPYPNATGRRILAEICAGCWAEWRDLEVKIINEYQLNMLEREHRKTIQSQLKSFMKFDENSDQVLSVQDS